ncbi:SAG-related sequence [Besnoitia besnoiti]|uniref:SAG-related sequence n=1 Tax=Besnoitia besnoiti TaxID=94643 RepID=A0A2A9MCP6_BESBE|nr:SAG-related sequence [Besnoitia besnoiti]PFH33706.1 SAG-related sequence [Besnoitia besnoiti]
MTKQKRPPFSCWKALALPVTLTALLACTVNGVQTKQIQGAPAVTNTCDSTTSEGGIAISVDAGTKKAEFVCGKTVPHVWPQKQDGSHVRVYFTGSDLQKTSALEDLFGVESKLTVQKDLETITKTTPKAVATLLIGALPAVQSTIYFACGANQYTGEEQNTRQRGALARGVGVGSAEGKSPQAADAGSNEAKHKINAAGVDGKDLPQASSTGTCLVTVTVPSDPNAPTCTLAKKSMEVDITSEAKSTTFSCDSTIPSLSPETSSGNIFDESCAKPVKLAEALPTAKLEPAGSGYTFSVVELPSAPTTLCYKCSTSPEKERGGADESCTVKIKVAAGLSSLAGLTHLQPVLAVGSLLVIGSVVFF